jgi:hypothetical protein
MASSSEVSIACVAEDLVTQSGASVPIGDTGSVIVHKTHDRRDKLRPRIN